MRNDETIEINGNVDEPMNIDLWEVVEIMGHQRIAGRVTEVERFGQKYIQVEVPSVDGRPAYVRRYSGAAIFSETELTKELVIAYLRRESWAVPNPILQLAASQDPPPDADEVGPVTPAPALGPLPGATANCDECGNFECTCDDDDMDESGELEDA